VKDGLSAASKQLSPAFLYDERGSNLFEDICKLDEYYLTRSEAEILESKSAAIVEPFDRETVVVVSTCLIVIKYYPIIKFYDKSN
jgi:L-histidine N-alpha-methyltransferase